MAKRSSQLPPSLGAILGCALLLCLLAAPVPSPPGPSGLSPVAAANQPACAPLRAYADEPAGADADPAENITTNPNPAPTITGANPAPDAAGDSPVRVIYHFADASLLERAQTPADYDDIDNVVLYEPRSVDADGVTVLANRHPGEIAISDDPRHFHVYENYAAIAADNPSQTEISDAATYDRERGTVTLPSRYAASDLTVVFYVDRALNAQSLRNTVTVEGIGSAPIVLESTRAPLDPTVSIRLTGDDDLARSITELTVTQAGVSTGDFTFANGSLCLLASSLGGPITVQVATDESVKNALDPAIVTLNEPPEIMTLSADVPYVGERFTIREGGAFIFNCDSSDNSAIVAGWPERQGKFGFLVHFYEDACENPDVANADINHIAPGGTVTTTRGGSYDYNWVRGFHFAWGDCKGDKGPNGAGLPVVETGWVECTGIDMASGTVTYSYELDTKSDVDGHDQQTIVGTFQVHEDMGGYVRIVKRSANGDLSEGNDCYNLIGAEYGIYSDAGCTQEVASVTTAPQEYGVGGQTDRLSVGPYWVREKRRPQGFALDGNVYPVTVAANQTTTVTSAAGPYLEELPQNQPLELVLIKRDGDNAVPEGSAQGDGTLAFAQFSIAYYDGFYDSEAAAAASGPPTRTWVFQTDGDGRIKLGATATTFTVNGQTYPYQVSGDALYHTSAGAPTLPLGTIVIRELAPPNGYRANNPGIVYQISSTSDAEIVGTYSAPTVTDDVIRGGVTIGKFDAETREAAPQGDATLAGVKIEIVNKSAHAVVVDGSSHEPGTVVATLSTDASGVATSANDLLPYGSYELREVAPPEGYLLTDGDPRPFQIREDGVFVSFDSSRQLYDDVIRGGVRLVKHDSETRQASPQGDGRLDQTRFTITTLGAHPVIVGGQRHQSGDVVLTIATDADGVASTAADALPYGRYAVTEVAAPVGYLLTDGTPREFTIQKDGVIVDIDPATAFYDDVIRGGVTIGKFDAETHEAAPQGDATLAGVKIEIVNKSAHAVVVDGSSHEPGAVVATLSTDASGVATSANDLLPYGSYELKEVAPPEGYLLTDGDPRPFQIREDGVIVSFDTSRQLYDRVIRGGVAVQKLDLESGLAHPLGNATLAGATFEVINRSAHPVVVDGVPYEVDALVVTLVTDETGAAATAADALPYGTYEISEVAPNDGYLLTDAEPRTFTVREEGAIVKPLRAGGDGNVSDETADSDADPGQWRNQVKRGNLEFLKAGEGSMHRLANVAFALTSQTTGERHILVTDENGYANTASSWNPHSQRTNANDAIDPAGMAAETLDNEAGIWFGTTGETLTAVNDDLGALPYDYYTLEELPSSANRAYELVTIPDIRVKRDNVVVDLGTIDDPLGAIPALETTATDGADGDHLVSRSGEATLNDVVTYRGLTPGRTYHLEGTLMVKETGAPLTVDGTPDGAPLTAACDFTPEEATGAVTVTFVFDATTLPANAELVVFETLSSEGEPVADHHDIDDEDQTVRLFEPSLSSLAADGHDGDKTIVADPASTIVDDVTLEHLTVGADYVLHSLIIDPTFADSGPAAALFNGLTPEENETTGDGDRARDFLLSYWESLGVPYTGDYENAETKMWFDLPASPIDEQSIALAKSTYDDLAIASTEQPFTADAETMTLTSTYDNLDTRALEGRTLRCFQMLEKDGAIVASEIAADYADEEVTVVEPQISTTATDPVDGDHYVAPTTSATIVDSVAYQGLVPGLEYRMSGVLMDKRTEEALLIDGQIVGAETTFIPEAPNGEIALRFTFDGAALFEQQTSSPDQTATVLTGLDADSASVQDAALSDTGSISLDLVVFESLERDGFTVAVHHDIDDAAQTVTLTPQTPTILASNPSPEPEAPATVFAKTIDALKAWWWVIPVVIGAAVIAIIVGRRAAGRAREMRRQGASQRALLHKIERAWSSRPDAQPPNRPLRSHPRTPGQPPTNSLEGQRPTLRPAARKRRKPRW